MEHMYTWQENVFFVSTSGASGMGSDNIGWCDFRRAWLTFHLPQYACAKDRTTPPSNHAGFTSQQIY